MRLTSKISLVISLCDLFLLIPKKRHAVAADKNCIPMNTHESRFSKNTVRIKSKNISFKTLFNAVAKILVFRLLELLLGKFRYKFVHI